VFGGLDRALESVGLLPKLSSSIDDLMRREGRANARMEDGNDLKGESKEVGRGGHMSAPTVGILQAGIVLSVWEQAASCRVNVGSTEHLFFPMWPAHVWGPRSVTSCLHWC
jgi:hypothetical protein